MFYSEGKGTLRNKRHLQKQDSVAQSLKTGTAVDSTDQLDRAAQVTIIGLRTGHCQLLSHLHPQ